MASASCHLHIRAASHGPILMPTAAHATASSRRSVLSRARLPHMDEELEHMQWQLDQRSLDKDHNSSNGSNGSTSNGTSSGHAAGGSSRHAKARKQRLVFRETSSSSGGHRQRQQHSRHHDTHPQQAGTSGSAGESASQLSAVAAGGLAPDVASQHQPPQFHCLQLDPHAAQDLHKAQERLARHIQQDGGCCVSAHPSHASTLTHLLLLLQHKQLKPSARHHDHRSSSSDTLLLLQPFSCDDGPLAAPAAGVLQQDGGDPAATGSQRRSATSTSSSSTALRAGGAAQHNHSLDCACSVDDLQFFATFLPLQTLLSVEHGCTTPDAAPGASSAATGAAQRGHNTKPHAASLWTWDSAKGHRQDISSSSTSSADSVTTSSTSTTSSLGSGSWAAESSTDEAAAAAASSSSAITSRSSSSRGRHSRHNKGVGELLRAASSTGGSSTAAVLLDAGSRGRLHTLHVGLHADPAGVAGHIAEAVAAGEVLGLHVRGQAAAHTAAYAALVLANSALQSQADAEDHHQQQQQQAAGFGVLLVQGHNHEHVHARSHSHSSNSSAPGMAQHAATDAAAAAAAAAAGAVQHHQHAHRSHAKVTTDASVGGFGAAFYGLSGLGDRHQQQQQAVTHRHGQEVWLCVVPLSVAG